MNNNAWFKKELPLQTVIGFGGGATGFGAYSSAVSKPYVDDVFSTYPYVGSGGSKTITNGIDFSTKGGLLWFKNRTDSATQNILTDTVRGVDKVFYSDANNGSTDSTINQSFNSDGWSMSNSYGDMNQSTKSYSSWSFAKQKGFFDMVQYTGNGSARTISHGLGCIPGLIMIKCISTTNSWYVYHRELGATKYLMLNNTNSDATQSWFMNDTAPTSSVFSLGTSANVNGSGETYMAYIFAGGKGSSDNAVEFDGTADEVLKTASSSDFAFGTGKFTVEAFFNIDADTTTWQAIMGTRLHNSDNGGAGWSVGVNDARRLVFYSSAFHIFPTDTITYGEWNHVAVVRTSTGTNATKMYLNGKMIGEATVSNDFTNTKIGIGNLYGEGGSGGNEPLDGKISNVRITKGQALYTTNFNPPHDPLTQTSQGATTSNVKLLCCNQSTTTGSTVTSATLSVDGSLAASTNNNIFDDTSAYIFGNDEDQGIIKTGKYFGNGDSDGPEIFLGWEPQWIMIRGVGGGDWNIVDCMRGINNGGNDNRLWANLTGAESTSLDVVDVTPTGFKIKHDGGSFNSECIYIAIRRPDGYVGKLPSAGTDVFAIDSWVSDSTPSNEPNMLSDFPVDFTIGTDPTHSSSGWEGDRFVRNRQVTALAMKANNTDNEQSATWGYFDYATGWMNRQGFTGYSNWTSWMWKRGQGMDVVCYKGDGTYGREIKHSLNQVPEMMWVKQRAVVGEEWMVYHKGLDGGNQPETHYIMLHSSAAEVDGNGTWNDTAPTSTHFTLGGWNSVNYSGQPQVAYLFASANDADGNPISKVGSYSGSSSSVTVTTGFQPRFVLIKRASGVGQWTMFDTFRGWTAGNDQMMELSDNAAQSSSFDYGEPTATGFTITTGQSATNNNGDTYLYYAHA